jgi:hypothetical protein
MLNNGNYNINNGDDDNTRNLPPPTLEHVMAIQGHSTDANATDHSTDAVRGQKNRIEKKEE